MGASSGSSSNSGMDQRVPHAEEAPHEAGITDEDIPF